VLAINPIIIGHGANDDRLCVISVDIQKRLNLIKNSLLFFISHEAELGMLPEEMEFGIATDPCVRPFIIAFAINPNSAGAKQNLEIALKKIT
jgi:hypothetical protein